MGIWIASFLDLWDSMTSKKRDASSWGVGGGKDAEGSSTINDPVYAQKTSAPAQPGSQSATSSTGSQGAGKDDPVYSQANVAESAEDRSGEISDPVYGQARSVPGTQGSAEPGAGRGKISAAEDPVYSQSQDRSDGLKAQSGEMNDPVYGQAQATPTPLDPPAPGPGKGTISAAEDPVYSQSQARSSTINDPVYGQPQSLPAPSSTPAPTPGTGTIPTSDDPVYSQSNPSTRLSQLTAQISPPQTEPLANTKRPRKAKKKATDPSPLPDDYADILTHLSTLRSIAQTPDLTSRGYQRQKTSGKLWSRERISALLDPNTWEEFGSVTGTVTWARDVKNPQAEHVEAFIPSNNPQGFGYITDPITQKSRKIYLTSDDFSIRSGHADGSVAIKTLYGEKLALRLKIPVVKLVDGSSGGGSVSTIMTNAYSYIPHVTVLKTVVQQLNLGIPNIGAVLGPAIGLGAARVVATHFSVMAGDIGSLFNAGPKVVEGATFEEGLSFADLGGPDVHCRNGTIDNLAPNEENCFRQIRTVLGYLPNCGQFEAPPTTVCFDPITREDIGLRSIIPRKKSRMYNPYGIITSVVDQGSWFEIGGLWGRTGITGLARLGGRPVGILSLNCEVNSGALDAMGSQKLMKMLKFCDVFNLPVVQFLDVREYNPLSSTSLAQVCFALGLIFYAPTGIAHVFVPTC